MPFQSEKQRRKVALPQRGEFLHANHPMKWVMQRRWERDYAEHGGILDINERIRRNYWRRWQ